MVAHASMKYSNVVWKSRFPRIFVLWWLKLVVFLPTGTFLNLPTEAEWGAYRASGTAGAPIVVQNNKNEKVDGEKKEEDGHNHEKRWEEIKTLYFHAQAR
jgi:hypothetical protein